MPLRLPRCTLLAPTDNTPFPDGSICFTGPSCGVLPRYDVYLWSPVPAWTSGPQNEVTLPYTSPSACGTSVTALRVLRGHCLSRAVLGWYRTQKS
jgi:hypothetical protein